MLPPSRRFDSGQRRRVVRVRAEQKAVLSYADGRKHPGRVLDVSTAGMHLESEPTPEYGMAITVIVRLDDHSDWIILPGIVRWFSGRGFGVEFLELSSQSLRSLEEFVDRLAA